MISASCSGSHVSSVLNDTGGLPPGNLDSVVDKILADLAIFQALHFNIAGSVLRGKTADLNNLHKQKYLCINHGMC